MEKLRRKIPDEDKLLAKFTLFAELSEEELHGLIEQSGTETYAAGERIISAGDTGHCMYVILSGNVRVTIKRGNGEIELASLTGGDFFGEVALVDDGPRSATVTATEDCELLCITRTTLGSAGGSTPGSRHSFACRHRAQPGCQVAQRQQKIHRLAPLRRAKLRSH